MHRHMAAGRAASDPEHLAASFEPLDVHPAGGPLRASQPEVNHHVGTIPAAVPVLAIRCVSERPRDTERSGVVMPGRRHRGLCFEGTESEVQDRGPHRFPDTATACGRDEPRCAVHRAKQAEVLALEDLNADDVIAMLYQERQGPLVLAPVTLCAPVALVERSGAVRWQRGVQLDVAGETRRQLRKVCFRDWPKQQVSVAQSKVEQWPR